MRKKPPPHENSKETISLDRIVEMLSELRTRVNRLESELLPYGPKISEPPQRPRKGRKPSLETERLFERRKNLTTWLEQNWPRLSVAVRKSERSGNSSVAIAALVYAKNQGTPGVFQPPFYDMPEQFEAALGAFLKSGRYHENPRNLAAAMAGLPELSWKRSFDICTMHPYKTGYAIEAYWDYMRRNFPDRLRELEEAKKPLDVKIILARSRTQDPVYLHLKENPERVKEWLEEGKPKGRNPIGRHPLPL
jgi:hypothetical protein